MTLTIDLPPSTQQKLESEAQRRGVAIEEAATEILGQALSDGPAIESNCIESNSNVDSILRMAARIRGAIPPDALENVPPDLARNLKHYLYGHPKEP